MSESTQVVGIRYVAEGIEQAQKAILNVDRAVSEHVKSIRVLVNASEANKRTLSSVTTATQRAEKEIRTLSLATQQGKISTSQFQQEVRTIAARLKTMGIDNATAQTIRYARSTRDATKVISDHNVRVAQMAAQNKAAAAAQKEANSAAGEADDRLSALGRKLGMFNNSNKLVETTLTKQANAFRHVSNIKRRFNEQEISDLGRKIQMMNSTASKEQNILRQNVTAFQNVQNIRRRMTEQELSDIGRRIALVQRSSAMERRTNTQKMAEISKQAAAIQRVEQIRMRQLRAEERARQTTDRVTHSIRRNTSATVANSAAMVSSLPVHIRVRRRFLETANSVAVLDGPLGGVASRFSAFGVLAGRAGLGLAALLVSVTALSVTMARGVSNFINYERQLLRLDGVLRATGNAAGIARDDLMAMVETVAFMTLAPTQDINNAAAKLLTFKSIGKDVFQSVLEAAADMAAVGFGTVESEATKLAKALEDPRQSLSSLSRSGITFTSQQRNLIISLAETGRHAEAMARILEVVNSQIGGAAQKEAEGYAGMLDTIGQALSIFSRQIGETTLNTTVPIPLANFSVGDMIRSLSDTSANFVTEHTKTLQTRLTEYQGSITEAEKIIEDGFRRLRDAGAIGSNVQNTPDALEAARKNLESAFSRTTQFTAPSPEAIRTLQTIQELAAAFDQLSDAQTQAADIRGRMNIRVETDAEKAIKRLANSYADLSDQIATSMLEVGVNSVDLFTDRLIRASQVSAELGEGVPEAMANFERLATAAFAVERAKSLSTEIRSIEEGMVSMTASLRAQTILFGQNNRQAQIQSEILRRREEIAANILSLEGSRSGLDADSVEFGKLTDMIERLRSVSAGLPDLFDNAMRAAQAFDARELRAQAEEQKKTAQERLRSMREEINLAQTIAQYGQDSAEADALRLSTAMRQTREFVDQNVHLSAAQKNALAIATLESQRLSVASRLVTEFRAASDSMVEDLVNRERSIELMAMGLSQADAEAAVQRDIVRLEREKAIVMAEQVLANSEISNSQRQQAEASLEVLRRAQQIDSAFDSAAKRAADMVRPLEEAAEALASIRRETSSFGMTRAGLTAQLSSLRSGADPDEAAMAARIAERRASVSALSGDRITRESANRALAEFVENQRIQLELERGINAELDARKPPRRGRKQQDVIGDIQREIAQRTILLDMTGRQRDVQERVFDIMNREENVSRQLATAMAEQLVTLQERERLLEVSQQVEKELADRRVLVRLTGEEYELQSLILQLRRQFEGTGITEKQIAQYVQANMELKKIADQQANIERLANQVESAFGDAFVSFVTGAKSAQQAVADLASSFARLAAEEGFRSLISGTGGSGAGGIFGKLLQTVAGAVVGSAVAPTTAGTSLGAIQQGGGRAFGVGNSPFGFSKGGVFDRPVGFPMANGRTGVMAEKDPEAIMPLKRGRDGSLGVSVSGAKQDVNVHVEISMDEGGNWKANVKKIADKSVQSASPKIVKQSVQATYAASREVKMK